MELPKFAAVAATASLALGAAGCGGSEHPKAEHHPPTTTRTQAPVPYRFPQAVDSVELVKNSPPGHTTYEHGVRIDNYKIPRQYPNLNLWGVVQYCTPQSSMVQERVYGYKARSYTDKNIKKSLEQYRVDRNIYRDHSFCDNGTVDPQDAPTAVIAPKPRI